mmetsp:Transcript_22178/g.63957  ORF Transcript_22178/g.63957 Transcript_22178/m.63957 type:complete len:247 (+) Transcript_22178:14-754(+)
MSKCTRPVQSRESSRRMLRIPRTPRGFCARLSSASLLWLSRLSSITRAARKSMRFMAALSRWSDVLHAKCSKKSAMGVSRSLTAAEQLSMHRERRHVLVTRPAPRLEKTSAAKQFQPRSMVLTVLLARSEVMHSFVMWVAPPSPVSERFTESSCGWFPIASQIGAWSRVASCTWLRLRWQRLLSECSICMQSSCVLTPTRVHSPMSNFFRLSDAGCLSSCRRKGPTLLSVSIMLLWRFTSSMDCIS